MKKTLEFIKSLDRFQKKVNLYYNEGNEKRSSWIGLIISIIYIFFYLLIFFIKFIRMINKVDLSVYDTFAYIEKPPSVNITNDKFFVGFGLEHPETYDPFIDETIYYPKAFFKKGKRIEGKWDWEIEEIEIEQCKLEYFGESFREKFKTNAIDNLYCLNYSNKELFGHFSYDNYSLFFIQLFPCKNSTENNNHCKPKEIIDEYLNGTYFCMEFEDIELTPQNYSNPERPRNQDIYFTVGKKLFQEVHIFFQIVNVETDKDILGLNLVNINNIKKDEYLKYYSTYYMNNFMEDNIYENEKPFCNITIKLHDQIRIQRRTYPKIIAIWGDVGGFMEFIFNLLKILSSFPIHILYEKDIVNKLFKFDLKNNYIYIKKFQKSKMPIDFQELYKNDQFNDTILDNKKKKTKKKKKKSNTDGSKTEKIDRKNIYDIISDDKMEEKNKINNITDHYINKKQKIYNIFNDKQYNDSTYIEDNEEYKNEINNNIDDDKTKRSMNNIHYRSNSNNNLMKPNLKEEEKIIEEIKFNSLYIYLCCFCSRKFKNRNNFLMDKGMEIFIDKMNVFTIFKKSINNEIILVKEPIVEILDIPLALKKNN